MSYARKNPIGRTISVFHKTNEIPKVVGNLGNLVFFYAASRLFDTEDAEFVPFYYDDNPEEVNEACDVIILPEANFISPSRNYSRAAEFISKTNKPCWLLGAGCQADISVVDGSQYFEIMDSTLRYLKHVSSHSSNIFVRGTYTAKLLQTNGISNVTALGCPSYTINPSPQLWDEIQKKASLSIDRFGITEGLYANLLKRDEEHYRIERLLMATAILCKGDYIAQTNAAALAISMGIFDADSRRLLRQLKTHEFVHLSSEDLAKALERRFVSFENVDRWLSHCSTLDFVTGSRFHGNMIPLQAATPALPIAHDSRTLELLDAMKIPYIRLEETKEWNSPFDILNSIEVLRRIDARELDRHRQQIGKAYVREIKSLGLTPSRGLLSMAAEEVKA